MKKLRRLMKIAGLGLLVWAISTELSKDPAEREWNGELAGLVPYDFRAPSVDKIRRTYWDTESDQVIKRKVFGVGWTLNLASIARFVGLIEGGSR